MLKYLKTSRALVVIIVGILVGLLSAKLLAQGTALAALPWGVLAFLTAFIAGSKREALALGGCLGFAASYSYLWFDNTDALTLGKVIFLIFLIILPAAFGLLCGMFCSWLGWLVKSRLIKVE